MRAAILFVWRSLSRFALRVIGGTFLAFAMLEVSIDGGFRAVVFPMGVDPNSPRAQELIERYHLDGNLIERYLSWLTDALRGDFGRSMSGDVPVTDIILHRLPISLELALVGIGLAVLIGIPVGLAMALWGDRGAGRATSAGVSVAQSIPIFVSPILFIWLFAVKLQWLPAASWVRISDSLSGNLRNLILPATALALSEVAFVARTVHSDVLRVLGEDYIAFARGKGLSRRYVMFRHALRPASLGLLNVIGTNTGALLGGAVIVEFIFSIGGIGQALLNSSINRDLPTLLGIVTYAVVVHSLINVLVDVATFAADPRIRRERSRTSRQRGQTGLRRLRRERSPSAQARRHEEPSGPSRVGGPSA